MTASSETTDYETYNFSYYYNRAGALTQENYPSGRIVTSGYDSVNRPYSLSGVFNGVGTSYVITAGYSPHGALEKREYGNIVWRTYSFNNRLQVNGLWDAIYDSPNYFLFVEDGLSYGTTNNNGNVLATNHWRLCFRFRRPAITSNHC